jgi:hypothetical protein
VIQFLGSDQIIDRSASQLTLFLVSDTVSTVSSVDPSASILALLEDRVVIAVGEPTGGFHLRVTDDVQGVLQCGEGSPSPFVYLTCTK